MGKAFMVQFAGPPPLAARRAAKLHSMQRSAGGRWTELHAALPDGAETRLFLDFDKSRKQVVAEISGKKAVALLKRAAPDSDWFLKRADAIIYSRWVPIARIVVRGEHDVALEFNRAAAGQKGIDCEAVLRDFSAAVADPSAGVQWG